MQVEINLLPEKKKNVGSGRKTGIVLGLFLLLGAGLIGASTYWLTQQSYTLGNKLDQLRGERARLEQQKTEDPAADFMQDVMKIVDGKIDSTDVMEDVMQPLGKRPIQSMVLDDGGTYEISASFQQLEHIAAYEAKLLENPNITGVRVLTVFQKPPTGEDPATNKLDYVATFHIDFGGKTEGGTS